jgi:catechol 2,3-dioxygenase-like lactoylglutathione lyase family enzyme
MSEIPELTFHHPALIVDDFEQTKRFYIEGLGAEEYVSWNAREDDPVVSQCCYLKIGNCMIELFAARNPAVRKDGQWLHICFETKDCRASVEAAVKAGAEIVSPHVNSKNHPQMYAFVKAPEGEIIEFLQRL